MVTLTIKWQRLVDEQGQTCERCNSTKTEVRKAARVLRRSLAAVGVRVALEEEILDPAGFATDPLQSNRIWLAGRPLEEWLGANAGQSPCSTCPPGFCEDVECRTIEIEGRVYEAIPAESIVKAGLLAASEIVPSAPARTCCGTMPSASGCDCRGPRESGERQ